MKHQTYGKNLLCGLYDSGDHREFPCPAVGGLRTAFAAQVSPGKSKMSRDARLKRGGHWHISKECRYAVSPHRPERLWDSGSSGDLPPRGSGCPA